MQQQAILGIKACMFASGQLHLSSQHRYYAEHLQVPCMADQLL